MLRHTVQAFAFIFAIAALAQTNPSSTPDDVFRGPTVVRLRVDKDHYYQERFEKIPYVDKDDVYLFAGENFGISLKILGDQVSRVFYEPDLTKADVTFSFSQEKELMDGRGMMLIITNKTKRTVLIDALMTKPNDKEIRKTTIVPIPPGLPDYESWPHPIVQLVLRNIRFAPTEEKH